MPPLCLRYISVASSLILLLFFESRTNPERIPNEGWTKDERRMNEDRTRTEREPNENRTRTERGPNEDRTRIITLYSAFNPNRSFVSWNDRIMPWYDVCSLFNLPFAVAVPFFDFAFTDWREGPVARMHKRSFLSVPIPVMSRAKTMAQVKSAFLLVVWMSLQISNKFSRCNPFFIHCLYPFVVMW